MLRVTLHARPVRDTCCDSIHIGCEWHSILTRDGRFAVSLVSFAARLVSEGGNSEILRRSCDVAGSEGRSDLDRSRGRGAKIGRMVYRLLMVRPTGARHRCRRKLLGFWGCWTSNVLVRWDSNPLAELSLTVLRI